MTLQTAVSYLRIAPSVEMVAMLDFAGTAPLVQPAAFAAAAAAGTTPLVQPVAFVAAAAAAAGTTPLVQPAAAGAQAMVGDHVAAVAAALDSAMAMPWVIPFQVQDAEIPSRHLVVRHFFAATQSH